MTQTTNNFERLTATPKLIRKATPNRVAYIVQNQSTQSASLYIAAARFGDVREALEIEPSGALVRDIFTPTGELWACTTAAGEAAGEGMTLAEDFQ